MKEKLNWIKTIKSNRMLIQDTDSLLTIREKMENLTIQQK